MTDEGTHRSQDLRKRARSLRPFPHEVMALAFVAAGVVVLERLPVTYPRAALLQVWAGPIALVFCLGLLVGVSAAILRKRHGHSGPDLATEVLLLVRAGVVLVPALSVHFLL